MYIEFLYPALSEEQLKLGPYSYVQLTYELLRFGPTPDGDILAFLNDEGVWELSELAGEHKGKKFSDVVVYVG